MNNPLIVEIPKNTWIKVVSDVVTGNIGKSDDTVVYYYTYRLKDSPAPTVADQGLIWSNNILSISATEFIDVYIRSVNANGRVEVMA